jgi:hypothetical protein
MQVIFLESKTQDINPLATHSLRHYQQQAANVLKLTMKVEDSSMEGYAKVAELMSRHSELAIFRQFRTLNLQMLLYQQAELTHLETELRTLVDLDIQSGRSIDHHQDWWTLAHDDNANARRHWEMAQQIQRKLEKYSTVLITRSSLEQAADTK